MVDDCEYGDPAPHGLIRGCMYALVVVVPFWLMLGFLIWRLWPYGL